MRQNGIQEGAAASGPSGGPSNNCNGFPLRGRTLFAITFALIAIMSVVFVFQNGDTAISRADGKASPWDYFFSIDNSTNSTEPRLNDNSSTTTSAQPKGDSIRLITELSGIHKPSPAPKDPSETSPLSPTTSMSPSTSSKDTGPDVPPTKPASTPKPDSRPRPPPAQSPSTSVDPKPSDTLPPAVISTLPPSDSGPIIPPSADVNGCTILILYNGAFPPFLFHVLDQIRCWNPADDCALWLVGNRTVVDDFVTEKIAIEEKERFSLRTGVLEDLEMTEDYWYFVEHTPLKKQGAFWVKAATRCFFIEAAMRKYGLTDVVYFETDVMPYFSVQEMLPHLRKAVPRFAVTPTSKNKFTLATSFIRNSSAMWEFNHFQRTNYTYARGGWEPAEMDQLADFERQTGTDYLYVLHVLPWNHTQYGKLASDVHRDFPTEMVFDSANWGQFYGGTPNGHDPGYTGKGHFVGSQLRLGCCHMGWVREKDGQQRWYPVVHWQNPADKSEEGTAKIMNLHIHSKQTKYMLNSCAKEGKPIDWVPMPEADLEKPKS